MEYQKSRKDEFLTRVIHDIEENLANENYSVDELAVSVGLSRSMLHRKLKKLSGKSAGDLIAQIRLEKARELLENDVGTSSEIAYRVGFNSPSYFNKVFKKYFGVSPGQLRKNPEDFYPEDTEDNKSGASHASGANMKETLKRSWKIAAGVGVFIIAAIVILYLIKEGIKTKDLAKLDKTIAVLPFENFSTDLNESHLGEGLANEIATQLAKIKSFEVRSFTSCLQYKGDAKSSMPQIGKELNANFIVEGSVELHEEYISIYVQVIQSKNDKHMWAEKFEGEWNDILTIRANIAKAMASTLRTILTPDEIENIETKPTVNIDAYNYYLRGNVFLFRSYEKQDQLRALNMYYKAVELDPQFALSYIMIAQSHLYLYFHHYDRTAQQLEKSKEAIETALEINPELGEVYIAYGLYYYAGFLNYDKALTYLQKAQTFLPYNSQCYHLIACVYRRMGDFEKAVKYFLDATNLDPNNHLYINDLAGTYYLLRNYSTALIYCSSSRQINPEFSEAHMLKIDLYLNKDGNTVNAKRALEEASLTINLSQHPELIEKVIVLHLFDENYKDAIEYLNISSFEAIEPQFYYYPKELLYAWTYDSMDDYEKASVYYNLSRKHLEEKIQEDPEDSRYYSSMGICYAGLNQKEKAIEMGKKGAEMLPIEIEAWRGYHRLMELAQIYVMTGEYDMALEQLDFLLSVPGELSAKRLQIDFRWKPLWKLPDLKELIDKYS
jgi:TolB-like protein/AraC-like DNA-binding protein/Tfp pilus assembly protein PilF